jgi:hypothetical protein
MHSDFIIYFLLRILIKWGRRDDEEGGGPDPWSGDFGETAAHEIKIWGPAP